MKAINNYDTSSTGVSVSYLYYRSYDRARYYLGCLERTETLMKINNRLYAWDLDYMDPRNMLDLDKLTEAEAAHLVTKVMEGLRLADELDFYLEECRGNHKETLIRLCEVYYKTPMEFVEDIEAMGCKIPVQFDTITVRGDVKGAWIDVLYNPEEVGKDFGSLRIFAEYLMHALFECPVVGEILIRTSDRQVNLSYRELGLPEYEWDPVKTVLAIRGKVKGQLTEDQWEIVRAFLNETLPEYLEYL